MFRQSNEEVAVHPRYCISIILSPNNNILLDACATDGYVRPAIMSSPKSSDRKSASRKQSFSHQRSSNEDIYQPDEYDTPVSQGESVRVTWARDISGSSNNLIFSISCYYPWLKYHANAWVFTDRVDGDENGFARRWSVYGLRFSLRVRPAPTRGGRARSWIFITHAHARDGWLTRRWRLYLF